MRVILILFAFFICSASIAETVDEERPLWELRLAGYGDYGAAYPASEDSQVNVVPLPFPIYRGKILRVGDESGKPITTRIFRRDRIKLDFDFGLNFPVDSNEIDARNGMPDLDLLLEAGPELELQFVNQIASGDLFLALQARGAVSLDGLDPTWRGAIFSTEFKYVRPIWTEGTELKIRLTPEFASADYMDYFYGVEPQYASGPRASYEAKAGYLGTRLSFGLKHEFTEKLDVRTGVRLGFYQGAKNEKSPLFTADTTTGVYVAVLYKLWASDSKSSTR